GAVSSANSLVGSRADDKVGLAEVFDDVNGGVIDVIAVIQNLTNGNYVVASPGGGDGTFADVGAVTWGHGATGTSGGVSAANSLVGRTVGDRVGLAANQAGVTVGVEPLTNGNYVVLSRYWNNGTILDAGAATWGNGTSGTVGLVSATNSLVGSSDNDH